LLSKKNLKNCYALKRRRIESRLGEFRKVPHGRESLFSELAFCICAANSSAAAAGKAQAKLAEGDLLFSADAPRIAAVLLESHVRFHNNKARYIVEAREKLFEGGAMERMVADAKKEGSALPLRDFLALEVMGVGYKEAGHYLRNIGMGEEVAILDRHILKNLKSLGVIGDVPKSLSGKKYVSYEGKMRDFSRRMGIPLSHLDLLFWSEETGCIFK